MNIINCYDTSCPKHPTRTRYHFSSSPLNPFNSSRTFNTPKKERKKERKKIRNKQNHNLLVDVRSNFPELGLLAAHKLARVGQIEEEHAHPRLHRRLLPHGERFRSFPQLQLLQT